MTDDPSTIRAMRERLAIPDRWWEKFDHHQDPTEPRECTCGLSWPCCIGILMGEKAALQDEVERLQAIERAANDLIASFGDVWATKAGSPLGRLHDALDTGRVEQEQQRRVSTPLGSLYAEWCQRSPGRLSDCDMDLLLEVAEHPAQVRPKAKRSTKLAILSDAVPLLVAEVERLREREANGIVLNLNRAAEVAAAAGVPIPPKEGRI